MRDVIYELPHYWNLLFLNKNIIFKDRVGNVSQWARSYAQRSATYRRPSHDSHDSHDSLPSILNSISGSGESENENENIEPPSLRRRGLLPPIQLSPDNNIFLPGIFLVCTFFKVVSNSQGRSLGCLVGFGIASSISSTQGIKLGREWSRYLTNTNDTFVQ